MWTRQNLTPAHRTEYSGIADQISRGGAGAIGFGGLAGPSDPEVWTKLSADQQKWITDSLVKLNNIIYQRTGTMCPSWGPSIVAAGGCFQNWFNLNYGGKLTGPDGKPVTLRTDGTFDQQTLDALRTILALNPTDFTTPFPGTTLPGLTGEGKKLSTGAMVGIAAAGATVLGALAYAVTRGGKKRRRGRR